MEAPFSRYQFANFPERHALLKEKIHPRYEETTVTCACGNTFTTRSTRQNIRVEVCSACHPFYSGTQRIVDTAGQVDRFRKRFKLAETAGAR